jgi:hypothetical protein
MILGIPNAHRTNPPKMDANAINSRKRDIDFMLIVFQLPSVDSLVNSTSTQDIY